MAQAQQVSRRPGTNVLPLANGECHCHVSQRQKSVEENLKQTDGIEKELPDILLRLNLNPDTWLDEFNSFKTLGITAVGTVSQLKEFCQNVGKKFTFGLRLKPALE